MTRLVTAGVLMAGVLATGCKTRFVQVSVHPFIEPVTDQGDVAGRWLSADGSGGLELVPAAEGGWQIRTIDASAAEAEHEEPFLGVVHFGRVDGTLYWDMTAEVAGSPADATREHMLALHSVARVRLDGDTMEIAFLQPDWLSAALDDGRIALPHFSDEDGNVILAAPQADLEALLAAYGDDQEAFGEREVFRRAP